MNSIRTLFETLFNGYQNISLVCLAIICVILAIFSTIKKNPLVYLTRLLQSSSFSRIISILFTKKFWYSFIILNLTGFILRYCISEFLGVNVSIDLFDPISLSFFAFMIPYAVIVKEFISLLLEDGAHKPMLLGAPDQPDHNTSMMNNTGTGSSANPNASSSHNSEAGSSDSDSGNSGGSNNGASNPASPAPNTNQPGEENGDTDQSSDEELYRVRGPQGDVARDMLGGTQTQETGLFSNRDDIVRDVHGKNAIDYAKEANEIAARKLSQLTPDNDPHGEYKEALSELYDYSLCEARNAQDGRDPERTLTQARQVNEQVKALNGSVTPPSYIGVTSNIVPVGTINTNGVSGHITRPQDRNM